MKVLQLFTGIGGIHAALIETKRSFIIADNYEISSAALMIYNYNYPDRLWRERNVTGLTVKQLEDIAPDLITMSPPCQPFTRQGLKKDIDDSRCWPFLHVLALLESAKVVPKMVFLENVAGFETSEARHKFTQILKDRNFNYQEFLISPSELGIPNSRLRYYLIAKLMPEKFSFPVSSQIHKELPACTCYISPREFSVREEKCCSNCGKTVISGFQELIYDRFEGLTCHIDNMHNFHLPLKHFLEELENPQPYLVKEKDLVQYADVFDIVTAESLGSCCFTRGYGRYIKGTGSVIQHNSKADLNKVYKDISLLSKDNPDYRAALLSLQLRYFTPKEMLGLMCYPNDFNIPSDVSNLQAYKCIGNSVNVYVVTHILQLLFDSQI